MLRRVLRPVVHRLKRWRFDNRRFWNARYARDMDKGSGPGSRGPILEAKRDLIVERIAEHGISSVIDLGCGDIEILRGLEIPDYRGVDIAEVVVARNRGLRPDWRFDCGEIGAVAVDRRYDMTLCLDVLIHQKARADYDAILAKIAEIASPVIVISGYERPPEGWNVFFHEPLSASLARALPDRRVTSVLRYRDTDLFVATPAG